MKIQPRLFLTSFCTLLASTLLVEAQTTPPRFGYGSVPNGTAVSPVPKIKAPVVGKTKPKAVTASTAKPKSKAATVPAKPKVVASSKTPSKAGAKSNPIKPTAKATPAKVSSSKAPPKEIVSAKTKASSSKSEAKARGSALSAKPSAPPRRPVQIARTTPAAGKSSTTGGRPAAPVTKPKLAATGPGDFTRASSSRGFNFFGSPIILPDIPKTSSSPVAPPTFEELMAARHSLGTIQTSFKPHLPEPIAVMSKEAPALTAKAPKPTLQPFVERSPETVAAAAPEIAPPTLEAADFHPSRTVTGAVAGSSVLLDEPTLARTAPVSPGLGLISKSIDSIPETTPLDEPALPTPILSAVEKPLALPTKTRPVREPEPPLPIETPERSNPLPEGITTNSAEDDLSERERSFVRSLTEAAGSIATASGQFNQDLPASITTAATAVLARIPAGTVSTFQTVAKAAKSAVPDVVPELPMEISNDLMPARTDKMPDQLPSFNAASSGKIDVQSDRQADYDQANNKVIFTGKVELNSAAIRLRAERVEVFMKKGGGGMERVEAKGNVLMRTQETENGPGQMASAGRVSYNLKTGEITLSDWPKIQEAGKSHISTDSSTKMYMFTDGRLRTDGPNRTLIGGG